MKLVNSEKKINKPLVWLEVSKKNLLYNLSQVKSLLGETKVMAVLKCNAYGLGLIGVAKVLEREVSSFGVVGLKEALILRKEGINKPIVNLGIFAVQDADSLIESNIAASIFTYSAAEFLDKAAKRLKIKAKVWIKVDTGLVRLGLPVEESREFIIFCSKLKNLKIEGVMSTLTEEPSFDAVQLERSKKLKKEIESLEINIPFWSIASSEALFFSKESYLDIARIGISLYGYYPSKAAQESNLIKLRPTVTFKTRVACIKEIEIGETVFYRRKFKAKRKTRVAVLLPGYTYGLDPKLVNGGEVLINGKFFPFIAGISATNSFVDIGMGTEIQADDQVVIIGKQKKEEITLESICELLGKNEYEILMNLPEKIERFYV